MKKVIVIAIGLFAIIFILSRIWMFHTAIEFYDQYSIISKLDSVTYTNKLPADYLHLFKSMDKLSLDRTDQSKRRNSISELSYDKRFYVLVYKMDTTSDLSLDSLIKEKYQSTPAQSIMIYYTNDSPFKIGFKEGPKEKVSNIYFSIFGDRTEAIKRNDSLAYYYSPNLENFSIKHKKDGLADIYGNIEEEYNGKEAPIEILFLRRNNNLYFILLTVKNKNNPELNSDLLYNLVIGK